MERCYPSRPIVGVGAFVVHEGKVLLIRRGTPPAEGLWSLPGGRQETGETAEQALEREIFEECGIRIKARAPIAVVDSIYTDSAGKVKYHYVIIDFWAEYRGGQLQPATDAAAARWIPINKINSYPLSKGLKEFIAAWGPLDREPSPPVNMIYQTIRGQAV